MSGLDDFQGDADFTEPEGPSVSSGSWPGLAQCGWRRSPVAKFAIWQEIRQTGLVPSCLFASTGFKIYSGFRIYIAEGDTAEMRFRDGSTIDRT